jgi:hypothetical protein
MSDPESFEENENIIMNIQNSAAGVKNDNHVRGNNFFQIKMDILGEQPQSKMILTISFF